MNTYIRSEIKSQNNWEKLSDTKKTNKEKKITAKKRKKKIYKNLPTDKKTQNTRINRTLQTHYLTKNVYILTRETQTYKEKNN